MDYAQHFQGGRRLAWEHVCYTRGTLDFWMSANVGDADSELHEQNS